VDPCLVRYFQPDFRLAVAIDAGGGPQPLPFGLVLRRIGREQDRAVAGSELRQVVECLYRMYGTGFRASDMEAVRKTLLGYPADDASVLLVPPTQ
jgi:hypothetical protein